MAEPGENPEEQPCQPTSLGDILSPCSLGGEEFCSLFTICSSFKVAFLFLLTPSPPQTFQSTPALTLGWIPSVHAQLTAGPPELPPAPPFPISPLPAPSL